MNHRLRQKNLELQAESDDLGALLIANLTNVRYLCGFTGSSGALAFCRGRWAFFTDGRYSKQAEMQVRGASIHIGAGPPPIIAARWIAERLRRDGTKLGIEAEHISIATKDRIRAELRSVARTARYHVVPTMGMVERLRIKKEAAETTQIRRAVTLASGIFSSLVHKIRSGTSENEVAAELEYLARRAGAEKMSFETIVASGPNSALPHARPTRRKIQRGFVVLDYGVILGGYCSDMTRTVWVGPASKEAARIYSAVRESQLAGIDAVKAGVEAQTVDAAARNVLRKHKLDKYFTHSLGHGVGLEIHEAPRLAKGQTQKLEAGMVVTIEPGVYIPDSGGVRIEDMVLVTENGCKVLTPTPKELIVR
ncbi:MAG TPA: aminopeptidase P family protein [Terriglobales bacterium]|nr:aminopeptidase P family protein [Terriglobales bacterium]